MIKLDGILNCIREMAPEELAEPWDNCGLILDPGVESVERTAVCLDITGPVADAAIKAGANLIISHHPMIFNPLKRITKAYAPGSLLYDLMKHDVAVYAAHTNVDKTFGGLNDLLAGIIGLDVLQPDGGEGSAGSAGSAGSEAQHECYRIGVLPEPLAIDAFCAHVRSRLKLESLAVSYPQAHGAPSSQGAPTRQGADSDRLIRKVVVMCGAFKIKTHVIEAEKPDAVICGEIGHHEALEQSAMGVCVARAGHHETERFFINLIEKWIKDKYPDADILGLGFSDAPFSYV